ncbi:MAG: hypothetical protein HQM14_13345 [SAR324 cluster bacterium]|nr:hypothetical protein [SAR324 cluster bacterium]
MAKKIKKQKAGMLKRKKQKQVKKAVQRRQTASRTHQQPSSEKELQKLLQKIPILAYEEELDEMRFDENTMRTHLEANAPDPQVLNDILLDEFVQDFQKRLKEMDDRTEGSMQKNLMVKGILYALDHQEMPYFINPLIIAIYLRSKADVQGTTLERTEILKAVEDYEKTHTQLIEEMVEALNKVKDETLEAEESFEAAVVERPQVDEGLMESFQQTLAELDEEQRERIVEDVEVFVEDFATSPVEEWNAKMLDNFLGNWFIRNLNPVVDDLVSMQNSLEQFFKFLEGKGKIPSDEIQKINHLLEDKETYKARMTA